MLQGYEKLSDVILKYREGQIDFMEYKQWLSGSASNIGYELGFEKDWYSCLDAWLEYIEFWYSEEDRYELGCSLGEFLQNAIENEPRPLLLPQEDRVVREKLQV